MPSIRREKGKRERAETKDAQITKGMAETGPMDLIKVLPILQLRAARRLAPKAISGML
jgi:hypothetical protein